MIQRATEDAQARRDWAARIDHRQARAGPGVPTLPPPAGVDVVAGRGQLTVVWEPVDGAIGYLVHRAPRRRGPWAPVDFGGGDVLAVPHGPFTDPGGSTSEERWYAVAALADIDAVGALSPPVLAPPPRGAGVVDLRVDAGADGHPLERPWRPMIGSEHLSLVLSQERTGGQRIGHELLDALRGAHDELGVDAVRAHGILCDDVGAYREVDGEVVHDFTRVDLVYDAVLATGLRPVVELSFMPRDLARDPTATVFGYRAVISPPRDWQRWAELVRALTEHLVDRYGLEELRAHWSFEVWNEANLEVFWSGTREEYIRLYEVSVRAVKSVDPQLRVGGPASAAAGWVDDLLEHSTPGAVPLDFVSTHTYGAPPLDLRPALERHGRAGTPLWWTEWGTTPVHNRAVGDDVFGATFLLRGMRSAMGRIEALAHWVVSDHFEELGRPRALLHGGFGLLTVGGLHKPRWWALALLERLGETEVPVALRGDGAGGMVEAVAARGADGTIGVLVWNGVLDQSFAGGAPVLHREVAVEVSGLLAAPYVLRHYRIDDQHSNVVARWQAASEGRAWPRHAEWAELRSADRLEELHPARRVDGPSVEVEVQLPMPAVSLLELVPAR